MFLKMMNLKMMRWCGIFVAVLTFLATGLPVRAERLYVAMNTLNSILSFDISLGNGAAVASSVQTFASTNLSEPLGLAIDADGNIYAVNRTAATVSKFDSTGTLISTIGSGTLSTPAGVAVDSAGNLYVSNQNAATISKFDSSGTFEATIGSENLSSPRGLAFDSAGNLYAANSASGVNTISKFDPSGAFVTAISGGGLSQPSGLAFNSSGNLYAANNNSFNPGSVSIFDAAGDPLTTISSTAVGFPTFITFDSAGNFYVANNFPAQIAKFDAAGTFQFAWDPGAIPAGLVVVPIPEPSTYCMALAGLACGGYTMFRRRKRA
jgi:DNA-binding beta-propeller fold protein YncE